MPHLARLRAAATLAFPALLAAGAHTAAAQIPVEATVGQSFVVPGAPFTRLETITYGGYQLAAGYTSVFYVFAYDGVGPTGPALFTQLVSGPAVGATIGFTVSPGLNLVAGDAYVFLTTTPVGAAYGLTMTGPAFPGALVQCNVTSVPGCATSADFDIVGFATTFSSLDKLATVPEPGTWALMGTGLLGVAGIARRTRAASA